MEGRQSKVCPSCQKLCLLVDERKDSLMGLLYMEGLLGLHSTHFCKDFQLLLFECHVDARYSIKRDNHNIKDLKYPKIMSLLQGNLPIIFYCLMALPALVSQCCCSIIFLK